MAEYQVIDKVAHDAELKAIGDSIRAKGGTTAPFNSAAEMVAAVDAIPGNALFDANVAGTLEGEVETQAKLLRPYAISYSNMTALRAPKAVELKSYALTKNAKLAQLELPSVEVLRDRALDGNPALQRLELPAIRELWGNPLTCFVYKLVLPAPWQCILHDSHVTGSVLEIYVPRALLKQYQAATNWSAGADFIYAIEDHPEITGG